MTLQSMSRGARGARTTLITIIVTVLSLVLMPGAPASAVTNGTAADPAPGWAAAIYDTLGPVSSISCTGTLIKSKWVLTAAHCAVTGASQAIYTGEDWDPYRPKDAKATEEVAPWKATATWKRRVVLGQYNASDGTQLDLASIKVNPAYEQTFYFEKDSAGRPKPYPCDLFDRKNSCRHVVGVHLENDAALLELKQVSGNTPIYLGDVQTDVQAKAYGYGRDNFEPGSRLLKSTSGNFDVDVTNDAGVLVAEADGSFTEPGDSGGPWVQSRSAGRAVQIGITSFAPGRDAPLYGALSWATSISAVRAWILKQLKSLPTIPAGDSTVLVFGTGDYGNSEPADYLTSVLSNAGYKVMQSVSDTLPADVASYGQIWYISTNPLSVTDQDTLVQFAQSGRGVYLTGERPCCEELNQSDQTIINKLVVTVGGVQVGGGDADYVTRSFGVRDSVIGGLAYQPNLLSGVTMSAPGMMSNVDSDNVFVAVSADISATPVGAAWGADDVIGAGRLVILMDINWLEAFYRDDQAPGVAENIALFLSGLEKEPQPVADLLSLQASRSQLPEVEAESRSKTGVPK